MSRFELGSKWATQGEMYFQVDVVDSVTREMVATTHGHTQEEAEAIARRIASAVNSHDELLAACKELIAGHYPGTPNWGKAREMALAAIRKAEARA